MKIKCRRSLLREGIQKVSNVINPRATLPILSNILLEAEQGKLKFSGTDLEMGISASIEGAVIEQTGLVTVPAKKISDIARELPDEEISISVKKNNIIQLEAGKVFYRIMGLAADDFPQLPSFSTENKEKIILSQNELRALLTMTAFAVSNEESRYVLNGILFILKDRKLKLVATDGRRLALAEKEIREAEGNLWKKGIILPIKAVRELNRLLGEQGEVQIYLIENQIAFVVDKTTIISRLIEGEFPDYEQVIPSESNKTVELNKEEIFSATRRVSLLTSPTSSLIKINLSKNKMLISSETPDLGEAKEEIGVEYQGEEVTIGFNPHYLLDMFRSIPFDKLTLALEESEKPGLFKADNFTCVLMPMQIE